MKIKKGDTVKILKGKDGGKSGKVVKMLGGEGKVLVDGLNLYKKHVRPRRQGEKGEIVQVPRPMAISNVALLCPSCNKAVRVGFRFSDGNKVRYCKKCNNLV